MKKTLLILSLVLIINSCGLLTPEQNFEREFPTKYQSSVTLDELLTSSQSLSFPTNEERIAGYGINAFFDNANLKVTITIPANYKVDRMWFIYSIYKSKLEPIDKQHTYITELNYFPELKTNINNNEKYYEFNNISSFIKNVVIRMKKDSQIYYLKNYVDFPIRVN